MWMLCPKKISKTHLSSNISCSRFRAAMNIKIGLLDSILSELFRSDRVLLLAILVVAVAFSEGRAYLDLWSHRTILSARTSQNLFQMDSCCLENDLSPSSRFWFNQRRGEPASFCVSFSASAPRFLVVFLAICGESLDRNGNRSTHLPVRNLGTNILKVPQKKK